MIGALVFRRLRQLLLPDFRRLWTRDLERSKDGFTSELNAVREELSVVRARLARLEVAEIDRRDQRLLETFDEPRTLDLLRLHVCQAVSRSSLQGEPMAHLVVEPLLPPDFYELLLAAMPPATLFPDRDPVKQDFEIEALDAAPALSQRVWRFFDREVVPGIIVPALVQHLHRAMVDRYAEAGGREFADGAAQAPHRAFAGRIQLRRPGYELRPHFDPKRVAITGLLYLAKAGDDTAPGTQLFSLSRPVVASGMKTFFPEDDGVACTLVRTVPFRPNTLLAFVNGRGAHGAVLPSDAALRERYSYQFYVKPDDRALKILVDRLPASEREQWTGLV